MNDQGSGIRVAVVGVGRMGRHHARTYSKMPQAQLLAVVDHDEERCETVADEYGCDALPNTQALLEKYPDVQAATIATPTRYHMDAARPLLERGIPCLIEKPLASTSKQAHEIAQLAYQSNALLQVGHTERFNPIVRSVAQMDMTARFIEIDRVSPMTFRSLDVGVVMDMMIHDLDIVLMLAKSPIARVEAAGVAVLSNREDIASARIVFQNGCVANITASRLALKVERKLRLFCEHAYVSLDYQKRTGTIVRKNADNVDILAQVRAQLEQGKDLSDLDYESLISVDELQMDDSPDAQDPLTAELASFLNAVQTSVPAEVDAQAGIAAVEAAERVLAAIREHHWEGLDGSMLSI